MMRGYRTFVAAFGLLASAGTTLAQDGLIIGVDNGAEQVYRRAGNQWVPLNNVVGFEVWGLAGDPATCTLYISAGFDLYRVQPNDSAPAGPVPFTDDFTFANISLQGLAFVNGQLYGTRTVSSGGVVEGIYRVNTANGDCSLVAATNTGFDFSACDADPATGRLFALSDNNATNPQPAGLYEAFLDGRAPNRLTDYRPAGEWPGRGTTADVDGLAIGNGRAYMVIDEPGEIAVYNLNTNTYESNIPAPWITSNIFSAAAWLPCWGGGGCTAPMITGQPTSANACSAGSATFTVAASGTSPVAIRWRVEQPPNSGTYVDLNDGTFPSFATVAGSMASTLTLSRFGPDARGARVLAVATNQCGTAPSNPVTLTLGCVADMDDGTGTGVCDGGVTIDDLLFFTALYTAGDTLADLDDGTGTGTRDAGVTIDDLLFFLLHYADGC